MFVVVFVVSAVAMIGTAAACHYDWGGDAPDPYSTLKGNNGANHGDHDQGYMLGSVWDSESQNTGQPDVNATGDDNDGTDDEDGVSFGSFTAGNPATVQVTVIAPLSQTGYLNAWVDFNADGDWGDPGEQIFTNEALTTGTHTLEFSVPDDATSGWTYSRFRFCNSTDLSYEGFAKGGEVEDYKVNIETTEIPEFSTIAIPVAGILGLMFFFNHRKRRRD